MPQQTLYQERSGAAEARPAPNVDLSAPREFGSDFWRQFNDSIQGLVGVGARLYSDWQESINRRIGQEVDAEMSAWEIEYRRTHKGVDAMNAQKDYQDAYAAAMERAYQRRADMGGNESDMLRWRSEAGMHFAPSAMRFIERGAAWQDEQKRAYDGSVLAGEMATYRNFISSFDPTNQADLEYHAIQLGRLRAAWAAANPGIDPREFNSKVLNELWHENVANLRMIAEETRDPTKLEAFLKLTPKLYGGDGHVGGSGSGGGSGGGGDGGSARGGLGKFALPGSFGWLSSTYESKGQLDAVGTLSTDGIALGPWQVASKPGGVRNMLNWCDRQGRQDMKDFAAALRGRSGKDLANAYKEQCGKNPALVEEIMRGYNGMCYAESIAVLRKRNPELASFIEGNDALREAYFSTLIQHGAYWGKGAGAPAIASKVYVKSGADPEKFLAELYRERGTRFPSSTPEVRENIRKRFVKEHAQASAYNKRLAGGEAPVTGNFSAPSEGGGGAGGGGGADMRMPAPFFGVSAREREAEMHRNAQMYKRWEHEDKARKDADHALAAELSRGVGSGITYALLNGDFSQVNDLHGRIAELDPKMGAEIGGTLTLWKTFHAATAGELDSTPLLQRLNKGIETMKTLVNPSNADEWSGVNAKLQEWYAGMLKKFSEDGAAFAMATKAGKDLAKKPPIERAPELVALQKSLGAGIPGFEPKIFSNEEARVLGENFAAMEGPQKFASLLSMRKQFGEDNEAFYQKALVEMGVPKHLEVLAPLTASINNPVTINALARAATMDTDKIPRNPDSPKDSDAKNKASGSSLYKITQKALSMVADPNTEQLANSIARTLTNIQLVLGKSDAESVMKVIENHFDTASDNRAVVLFQKKGAPMSAGKALLLASYYDEELKAKMIKEFVPPEDKTKVETARKTYCQNVRGLFENSVWVSTGVDGHSLSLVWRGSGKPVADRNGKAIILDLKKYSGENGSKALDAYLQQKQVEAIQSGNNLGILPF